MFFRISEAGSCPRKILLQSRGIEGEPIWEGSERAFAEGNLHEGSILEWACQNLPGAPYSLQEQQKEVYIPDAENPLLIGHIDGLGVGNETVLLEAKTLGRIAFQELREKGCRESHPQYYTQVQLYLHALGLEKAYLVARNKETPKTRMWDMHYEEIVYDAGFVAAEIKRLEELKQVMESGGDIPPPYNPQEHWQCRRPWCPYTYHCYPEYAQKEKPAIPDGIDLQALEQKITAYNDIITQVKELEEVKDALKTEIMNMIPVKTKLQVAGYQVEVQERRSERFDTTKARKALPPEVLADLIKVSISHILTIKEG